MAIKHDNKLSSDVQYYLEDDGIILENIDKRKIKKNIN